MTDDERYHLRVQEEVLKRMLEESNTITPNGERIWPQIISLFIIGFARSNGFDLDMSIGPKVS